MYILVNLGRIQNTLKKTEDKPLLRQHHVICNIQKCIHYKCLKRDITQLRQGLMDGSQGDYKIGKLVVGQKAKGTGFVQLREVTGQEGKLTALPVPTKQSQGRWKNSLQSYSNRSRRDGGHSMCI